MPPKINPKAAAADGKGPPGKEAPGEAAAGEVEPMEVTRGGSSAVQKDAARKIAELEQQLSDADAKLHQSEASRKQLQDLLDACLSKDDTAPSGGRASLEDRLRELGFVDRRRQPTGTGGFSAATPYTVTSSFEIRGGALDYKVGCGCHLQMKLDQVPGVKQPPGSSSWSASSPFGLAQGVHVAESVTFSADDQEAFFLKKADALVRIGCVEPSEDLMVKVVVQVARLCPAVMDVFAQTQRAQYTCDLGFNKGKADMRIRVAEKARAILDGERALQTAETIVIGGVNAVRFAAELGQEAIKCETLVELRQFLEASHFSSTVKRVFVWPDTKENFVASTYVKYLKEAVTAAAQWKHVVFIVLPMPFAHADVSRFESYMIEFNTDPPKLDNVLWLDESWLFKGYRFSRSLGANEIAVDEKAVFPEGSISKRGAAAAVKFLKGLCAWLIIDTAGQGAGLQTSGPSTSGNQLAGPHQVLHGVREGKVAKQQARGVPSRGGGGGRQSRGRGNSNAGNRHRQGQPK